MQTKPDLRPVYVLAVLVCLPEFILIGADWGLWGGLRWRSITYSYGAFWKGLLGDWQSNFAAQPATMFLSYSFLHRDFWHLLGNLLAGLWLGRILLVRLGGKDLATLWALAVLGGALTFALLSTSPRPMVGASGGIFGLVTVWVWLRWQDRPSYTGVNDLLEPALLVGFQVVSIVVWPTSIAWETHLGGSLLGLLFILTRSDCKNT